MKKILLILLFASSIAQAQNKKDITAYLNAGGMFTDHGAVTATIDSELVTQYEKWQNVYDVNYNYQQLKFIKTIDMGYAEAKRNYSINDRNYLIADARYDYNKFRRWTDTYIAAAGWGYKIYHSDNFKISNELTSGYRRTNFGDYTVVRDSIWIRYSKGPITVYNKFLYEKSNVNYYRNQVAINYAVTGHVAFGIQNLYTKDIKENNITSFTLSYKF